MPRVSLEDFMRGLTSAYTGQIAGHLAGQQQADARDQQQFQQALSLAQLGGQEQDRRNALLMHELPNLEPGSQSTALAGMFAQPSQTAALANHPFIQKHPEYRPFFAQQAPPAPAGAPGGWMGAASGQPIPTPAARQPLGERQFAVPGIGTMTVAGVGKADIAAINASRAKLEAQLVNVPRDPAVLARIDAAKAMIPTQIRTPEQLAQARRGLEALSREVTGTGATPEGQLQSDIKAMDEWKTGQSGLSDEQWLASLPGVQSGEEAIAGRLKGRPNPHVYLKGHEQDITNIQGLRDLRDRMAAGQATDTDMATGMDLPALNDSIQVATKALRGRLEARLSPKDEEAASRDIRAQVDKMNPLAATPDTVRALYKNWHGRDLSYLVEGLPDEALKLGDARLYTRRAQLTGQLANWVNTDPKGQQILLSELKDINAKLGIDQLIPDRLTPQLTPAQKEQKDHWQKDYELRQAADARAEADLLLRQQKADRDQQEKLGTLTPKQHAALSAVDKDLNAAAINLRTVAERERVRPSQITDYNNPADQRQAKYVAAYRAYEAAVTARKMKLRELGINVPDVKPQATPAFRTPEQPKTPEKPGLLDQARETFESAVQRFLPPGGSAKASATGTPQTYRGPALQKQQLRQQLIAGLKARKRTDAQINAVLRAHPELW